MPESPSFDDELVITSPWSGDLLVAEMEAHGQLIVRGSHRSQQVALRTLQAHYGEREVGVRTTLTEEWTCWHVPLKGPHAVTATMTRSR